MTWEDHIAEAMKRGYFRAEEYVISFYFKTKYIGSIEAISIGLCAAWIQFTGRVLDLEGKYDVVRIKTEGLPEMIRDVEDQYLKQGDLVHIRIKRPIA